MALVASNVCRALILYGGSILPARYRTRRHHDSGSSVRGGRGDAAGKIGGRRAAARSRSRVSRCRGVRRAVHGEHDGDGDGTHRALWPIQPRRRPGRVAFGQGGCAQPLCGELVMDARPRRPAAVAIRALAAFDNAIASVSASGGSTNGVPSPAGHRPRVRDRPRHRRVRDRRDRPDRRGPAAGRSVHRERPLRRQQRQASSSVSSFAGRGCSTAMHQP